MIAFVPSSVEIGGVAVGPGRLLHGLRDLYAAARAGRAPGSVELAGRNLYISEGCIECHTQAVRPVGSDVGLGPVSIAGDYANESPALLGGARFGPDLMHFATSSEFFDKVLVQASLQDPRALRPWSTMPSYSYLSSDDLSALVSYIETLR